MLRREEIKDLLAGYGMTTARVIGWAGAGKDLPGPAEIAVDINAPTDLTGGDLAKIDREVGALVGLEVVVVVQRPGEGTVLPGEKIKFTKAGTAMFCRPDAKGRLRWGKP
ncbi:MULTISPECIES: hypothetical protein [Arsenicicoccus]|uniref:hypothetical protein n=1 Tax=Arsenicicoccus TaxID=267408 RepID=UPI000406268B|nr:MULTISPECIES: hypothetical protein [Arsenicicoccus]